MTADEFKNGMERLRARKTWASSFDASFEGVLLERIRKYPWRAFAAAIKEFMGQHNKPDVKAIVQLCSDKAVRMGFKEKSKFDFVDCQWCDGFGIVLMESPAPRSSLRVFICGKCNNGHLQHENVKDTDMVLSSVRVGWDEGFRPHKPTLRARYEKALQRKSGMELAMQESFT